MPYAIITGGTQGMGRVITGKLLQEGFSVAVCARSESRLEAAKAEWQTMYPAATIIACPADISTPEGVGAFAETVLAAFPTVDVLVNNAGTFQMGAIAEEPEGRLEEMLAINLFGAYRLTRKVLPVMMREQKGHIFNICSVAGIRPNPGSGAYSISKYALMGFSENLREELRPWHIKVTAICPGSTFTSSWEGSNIEPGRILEATDISSMLWSAYSLSPQANVDTIIVRPLKDNL